MNCTIKEMLASVLIDAKISMRFWIYGLKHACVLWNTGHMFKGVSLEEQVQKRRVDYSKIQPFGAECWVHVPPESRRKGDLTVPKAWKGKLLSINFPGSGYIVLLDGEAEKQIISRDVVFRRVLDDATPAGDAAVSDASATPEISGVAIRIIDLDANANTASGGNEEQVPLSVPAVPELARRSP
jgi:hypothetical protein